LLLHLRSRFDDRGAHVERRRFFAELTQQAVKAELGEQRARGGVIGRLDAQVVQRTVDCDVIANTGQLTTDACRQRLGAQALGDLARAAQRHLRHRVESREHVLEIAEGLDERDGGLLADAGDAGNVVDRVAHQRHDIDDAIGRHTELGLDGSGIRPAIAHRVPQLNVGADELHQVLVAGDDDDIESRVLIRLDHAGDDVIGLDSRHADLSQPQRRDHAVDPRNLRRQVARHFAAVRFVLRVDIVAECRARRVEHHRGVRRPHLGEQLEQHGGEAVDGVGRQAARPGERWQREERPIDVCTAVH
jgi:hypothetical protein